MTEPDQQIENLPQLIALQASHVTQYTNDGVKTDWKVRENITSNDLHTLPKHLSDNEVFSILDFAKKYELIAFNAGIKFQKGRQNEFLTSKIRELEMLVKEFATENKRITNLLETALERED